MRYKNNFFRKILPLLGCLSTFNSVAQTPYNPSQVSFSGNHTSGTYLNGNSGSNPYNALAQNFTVSSVANYTLKPTNVLQILAPMSVNNLTSGTFHVRIEGCGLASFHTNGWSNIPKYDRFEIGINLPLEETTDPLELQGNQISNDIIRFLQNPGTTSSKLNPYDPDQLKIKCTFVSATSQTYVRYAFHYTPYTVELDQSSSKLYWDRQYYGWYSQMKNYPFRIRFAPPETGTYQCKIETYINNILQPGATEFTFIAVTNTANPIAEKGHLEMSTNGSLKLKYESGDHFFGIGQNIPVSMADWSETTGNFPNGSYSTGQIITTPERHILNRNRIQNLADNGGNFLRLRLDDYSVPIEWYDRKNEKNWGNVNGGQALSLVNCVNNYYHNQMFMGEMDQTLALCEEEGIKVLLTLISDADFSLANLYGIDWWVDNPYHALLGGGTTEAAHIQEIKNFFDPNYSINTREIFKKRLFYIMARWGYSTSIGVWQMINETETTGGTGSYAPWAPPHPYHGKLYNADITFRSNLVDWICEMVEYMKGLESGSTDVAYPTHPFTTGTVDWDEALSSTAPNYPINMLLTCLDIKSLNSYPDFANQSTGKFQNDNDGRHYIGYNKFEEDIPWVHCEIGMANMNLIEQIDALNDRPFHNSIWTTAMSGNIATGMYWNDNEQKILAHRPNFKSMAYFFSQVDLTKVLKPKRKSVETNQNTDNSEYNGTQDKKIFNFYMMDDDKEYIIGWSQLGSSYWANDDPTSFDTPFYDFCTGCSPQTSTSDHAGLLDRTGMDNWTSTDDYDASVNELDVVIYNVIPNQVYDVTLYKAYGNGGTYGTTFQKTSSSNSQLKFSKQMLNHDNYANGTHYPDFAYIIQKNTGQRLAIGNKTQDEELAYSNIQVFPNPASNSVNIAFDPELYKESQIQILNETGQVIISKTNERKIDVRELTSGFYILKFSSGDFVKTFKISIIH